MEEWTTTILHVSQLFRPNSFTFRMQCQSTAWFQTWCNDAPDWCSSCPQKMNSSIRGSTTPNTYGYQLFVTSSYSKNGVNIWPQVMNRSLDRSTMPSIGAIPTILGVPGTGWPDKHHADSRGEIRDNLPTFPPRLSISLHIWYICMLISWKKTWYKSTISPSLLPFDSLNLDLAMEHGPISPHGPYSFIFYHEFPSGKRWFGPCLRRD